MPIKLSRRCPPAGAIRVRTPTRRCRAGSLLPHPGRRTMRCRPGPRWRRPASARSRPTPRRRRRRRRSGGRAAPDGRRGPRGRQRGGWRAPTALPRRRRASGRASCGSSARPSRVLMQVTASAPAPVHRVGHLDDAVGVRAELGPAGTPARRGRCDHLGRQRGVVGEDRAAPFEVRTRQVHLDRDDLGRSRGQQFGGRGGSRRALRPQMLATTRRSAGDEVGDDVVEPVLRRPAPGARRR